MIFSEYVDNNMDKRLPGVLSLAMSEGYREFHEMTKNIPLLKLTEARNSYGTIRLVCVNIMIKEHLIRAELVNNIRDVTVSPNGYTYQLFEVDGGSFTAQKTLSVKAMPRHALYRDEYSALNTELLLFDHIDDEGNIIKNDVNSFTAPEVSDIYFMLTYGGKNYNLDFLQMGLPSKDNENWIERIPILNRMAVISPSKSDQRDLEVSFKKEFEGIMGESDSNEEINNLII